MAMSSALLTLGGAMSILLRSVFFFEVPLNFRRNLTIRHPVNGLNTDDASMQLVSHETFLQLALGLARTKYQNRFCITNTRNDRIVVNPVRNSSRALNPAGIIVKSNPDAEHRGIISNGVNVEKSRRPSLAAIICRY